VRADDDFTRPRPRTAPLVTPLAAFPMAAHGYRHPYSPKDAA
jgi:hypothetical protein